MKVPTFRPVVESPTACLLAAFVAGVCTLASCGPESPEEEDSGGSTSDVAPGEDSSLCQGASSGTSSESNCGDGLDNDCDGKTDCGDADCTGSACGLGEGTAECIGGSCRELNCYDGIDNDEDGHTDCRDPDCTGEVCADGTDRTCPTPSSVEDDESSCDELDNDCDGTVDEGCECVYDPSEASNVDTDGSNDEGVCRAGSIDPDGICTKPDAFNDAEVEADAGLDFCDGKDNDCDGETDEGCTCTYDPEEPDQVDTDASNDSGVCLDQPLNEDETCEEPSTFEDPETLCADGKDNDCDGETDEASMGPGSSCAKDCQCTTGPCVGGTCAHTLRVANVDVTGNIGGLTDADDECGAGERALLSTDSRYANARLDIRGPIVNASGTKVADDQADLFDGSLDAPITSRKNLVWTGTDKDGTSTGSDCDDWSSSDGGENATFGRSTDTDAQWVDTGSDFFCDATLDLYCLNGQ